MSYRETLNELHAHRTVSHATLPDWDDLAARARAHRQAGMLVHALGLTADQLRAAQLHRLDPQVREALEELSERFGGLNRPEVLANYDTEAALEGLRHATRGTVMEHQVEQLFEAGEIELPDGAVRFEPAERMEPGVDGWFVDADGDVVQEMQIKASSEAAIILEHLRRYPEVTDVYSTTEAAQASARAGLGDVVDTGVANADLVDLVESDLSPTDAGDALLANVPVVTLGLATAEYVRNLHRGVPHDEARRIASGRTGVALTYSAIAWMVASFSGIEVARFGVVAVGEGSRWVVRRLEHELEPSLERLHQQRKVLESLAGESHEPREVSPRR